ncbi:MAG: glycoside hydrolase family 127 protein, partial [Halanaerobiales bacterium]|nr:glycoside hydrolase family 127 protein [Halanaerobiales bacterium]
MYKPEPMKTKLVFVALFFSIFAFSFAQKVVETKYVVPSKIADKLHPISIKNLKLEGEIGRRVDVTINNNIKKLDLDKNFTGHFEVKTGPEVVGAFVGMGMLIDASVRLAAYSKDPEMVSIKEQIVKKIIDEQLEDGYIGFYKPERRLWNSEGLADNWDIHEMAFIIDGLLSDYQFFGNKRALKAAIKTADFIISRWHEMPDDYDAVVDMHVLDTGFDWAIMRLYRFTGEERFLDFSENVKSLYEWDTPITIGRRKGVSGHMFAYFAMCVAQMELYRLTGNEELLDQTKNAIDFFLKDDGLTITGSAGIREIWTNDQDGEGHLGETCATAYQVRVYESLLRMTGEAKYGDLLERTAFNGLFAAQSPEGDKLRYYTPFEGEREYYQVEYMCCPGNFRRVISELPGMVYYTTGDNGVAVNMYAASSAKIGLGKEKEVLISQETKYPTDGKVEITVSPKGISRFPVSLRIPLWAANTVVKVNGEGFDKKAEPGT